MRGWGRVLAWAGLMALVGLMPIVIGWSGLPDPVATHWGSGGVPDGTTSKQWIWLLPLILVAIGLVTSSFMRREGEPSAEAMAMLGIMGGVAGWVSLSVVTLNHGVATWEDAAPFGLEQIIGVLVAAALLGFVGYRLGKRWFPSATSTATSVSGPAIEVGDDERVFWSRSERVWWPFAVLVPFGVIFLFLPGWLFWLGPVFFALALLFSSVAVVVDGNGLTVRLGGFWPVRRIPLDQVSSSRPIDLEPAAWGGWGYRVVPGGSAIVIRRGDAIEVITSADRKFAVTVDDAATGSALLNGLVDRAERL